MAQEINIELIKNKVAITFKQELLAKVDELTIDYLESLVTYDEEQKQAVIKYGEDVSIYDVNEMINYKITKIIKMNQEK